MTCTTPIPGQPVKRGFPGLTCFKCGETDCISLAGLSDLSADDAFTCRECNTDFSAADVREMLDGWSRLLAWIDAAPTCRRRRDEPCRERPPTPWRSSCWTP